VGGFLQASSHRHIVRRMDRYVPMYVCLDGWMDVVCRSHSALRRHRHRVDIRSWRKKRDTATQANVSEAILHIGGGWGWADGSRRRCPGESEDPQRKEKKRKKERKETRISRVPIFCALSIVSTMEAVAGGRVGEGYVGPSMGAMTACTRRCARTVPCSTVVRDVVILTTGPPADPVSHPDTRILRAGHLRRYHLLPTASAGEAGGRCRPRSHSLAHALPQCAPADTRCDVSIKSLLVLDCMLSITLTLHWLQTRLEAPHIYIASSLTAIPPWSFRFTVRRDNHR